MGGVQYAGFLNRAEINELYGKAVAGLVVLLPAHNYTESLPIKMFEYMAAGLPFVASDFPLWKQIVAESNAGICVNPLDAQAVRNAITYLFEHRAEAQQMGQNGRRYVVEKCSWAKVETVLLSMYENL